MGVYSAESGVGIVAARVRDFRSLANIEVDLGDLTVLIGANNAGKTSFLDALFAAIGAGRKSLGADDVRLAAGESGRHGRVSDGDHHEDLFRHRGAVLATSVRHRHG